MIYNLKPKTSALKYLLGNIDQLDISYVLQNENKRSYNNLLICFDPSMLNILYKYDQFSSYYETDQTDVGSSECLMYNTEYLSDNLVKINITQKFVRCFSYYKEKTSINTETGTTNNSSVNYISLYPSLFLDYENTDLVNILTTEERTTLLNSKVMNVEFNTSGGYQIPTLNTIASRGVKYPSYIELFTFVDSNVNYSKLDYSLQDSVNKTKHTISLQNDSNPGEDKYSSYAKTFNVINDSTIIMEFEFYVNINNYKYLLDINDVNINYHINVSGNNTIGTGTFNLDIYEKLNNNFQINDIIYIKDIYNDTVEFVGKILNITNNTLSIMRLWSSNTNSQTITAMDKYILNKIKNLENFNNIQNDNNLIRRLIDNNLFVIDNMTFTIDDYLTLNNLG